jgi:hypothetical protein
MRAPDWDDSRTTQRVGVAGSFLMQRRHLAPPQRVKRAVRLLSKKSYVISQCAVFARGVDMAVVINVVLSALVIGVAAWLSGRFPRAAGFLVALPLATMLVLPMAHLEHKDAEKTVEFAKSIFIAVPVVMLFLLPFILAVRFGLSFWVSYVLACLWLIPAFFLHRSLLRLL